LDGLANQLEELLGIVLLLVIVIGGTHVHLARRDRLSPTRVLLMGMWMWMWMWMRMRMWMGMLALLLLLLMLLLDVTVIGHLLLVELMLRRMLHHSGLHLHLHLVGMGMLIVPPHIPQISLLLRLGHH